MDPARYRVNAVDRAIDLLMAFTPEDADLSLAELASRTHLSKPTAFRLIATLRLRGLITQETKSGRYRLGFEILPIAAACQVDLRERAIPIMTVLRDEVNETVILDVRQGQERITVHALESRQPVRRAASTGDRRDLYRGASSKVLLSALNEEELTAFLGRLPAAIRIDGKRYRNDVVAARSSGWADSQNERNEGGASVSAAVRDRNGAIEAAMQIAAPATRFTKELHDRTLAGVVAAASALSTELGYRPAAVRSL